MVTYALIPGLICDEMVWSELAEQLPADAVYRADLRFESSISGMAQSVLAATAGPLVAIGHSMGGRVAMEMARMAPERMRGLVLANTGHHPRREGEEVKRREMIDLGHKSMSELADTWLPPMVDPARHDDKDLMGRLRAMVLRADADQHERQIMALLNRPDATSYLADLTCPILLIAARQDAWSPVDQHQEIADAAPKATVAIIENAGHFAPVERPAEVAKLILDWLRTLPKDRKDLA